MIFKVLISFLLLILINVNCSAQSEPNKWEISEVRKNKYQIELGFSSIRSIYTNTSAANIMLKKRFRTGELIEVNSVKFLRAYFSIDSHISFDKDPNRSEVIAERDYVEYFATNNSQVNIGFGIEKQIQQRRFVHYYGCDMLVGHSLTDYDIRYYLGSGSSYVVYQSTDDVQINKQFEVGLIPFIGMKFYITPQFSVGLESGVFLNYFHTSITQIDYEIEDGILLSNEEQAPIKYDGLAFDFLGMRFFTVGYSF